MCAAAGLCVMCLSRLQLHQKLIRTVDSLKNSNCFPEPGDLQCLSPLPVLLCPFQPHTGVVRTCPALLGVPSLNFASCDKTCTDFMELGSAGIHPASGCRPKGTYQVGGGAMEVGGRLQQDHHAATLLLLPDIEKYQLLIRVV